MEFSFQNLYHNKTEYFICVIYNTNTKTMLDQTSEHYNKIYRRRKSNTYNITKILICPRLQYEVLGTLIGKSEHFPRNDTRLTYRITPNTHSLEYVEPTKERKK